MWCKKEVRVSGSSLSNLRTHRDGSRQTGRVSDGCPQRQKAIEKGAKLPATSLQEIKNKTEGKDGSIATHFNRAEKFDNETLNNILSLWLLRQAIPWNRIEDPYLRAAFHYCEPGSTLFKRKWAATSGRVIYLDLQEAMINRLKVCYSFDSSFDCDVLIFLFHQASTSKFTLIHDVWTTKGNCFGFIGALVSFIDNDWNYIVQHLALKLVAWHHKGSLLAEPIVNVLAKHGLQRKISIY